jgi:RNA-directed DNA polymerase
MKRASGLFKQITNFDQLIKATRRAMSACGRVPSAEAAEFYVNLEPACLNLRRALLHSNYRPGPYRTFMLFEPKPRLISAAPFVDRVVHHSLCAALEPHFERFAIYDSYACRKGKGLHRAIQRAQHLSRRFAVYLKLDIHHYFERAHHDVLKHMLKQRFKEFRLLELCTLIIDRGAPGSVQGRGLPIGNLSSQHFANFYLSHLDRMIKQNLGVKGYLRYMDDMLLFADDFQTLRAWKVEIDRYLKDSLQLSLKARAERLDWVSSGVPFLGVRITPHHIRFDQGRKRRLLKRLTHLNRLEDYEVDNRVIAQAASLYSWAHLADSDALLDSWHQRWHLFKSL